VLHRLRLDVFKTAARTGVSLIFTNNSAWQGPHGRNRFVAFATQSRKAYEVHGGRVVFVRLSAPQIVLEERLTSDARQASKKLLDVDQLRKLVEDLDDSPIHDGHLLIDTSAVSADAAARTIFDAVQ
jgi:hypothetical protein